MAKRKFLHFERTSFTRPIVFLALFVLTCFSACKDDTKTDNSTKKKIIQAAEVERLRKEEENQKKNAEEDSIVSSRVDEALKDAFKIAKPKFKNYQFTHAYDFMPGDSSFVIQIDITIGKLFDDNKKYFLLRRHTPWAVFLNLYELKNYQARELTNPKYSAFGYIRDTIFDVNGDGNKDFLVNWEPLSGCCRRDSYDLFLNDANDSKFSKHYDFTNPVFFPKEKIIRGRTYGRDAPYYKFKWRDLELDTIEYIHVPQTEKSTQYIRSRSEDGTEKGEKLKALPREYERLFYEP